MCPVYYIPFINTLTGQSIRAPYRCTLQVYSKSVCCFMVHQHPPTPSINGQRPPTGCTHTRLGCLYCAREKLCPPLHWPALFQTRAHLHHPISLFFIRWAARLKECITDPLAVFSAPLHIVQWILEHEDGPQRSQSLLCPVVPIFSHLSSCLLSHFQQTLHLCQRPDL